MPRSARSSAFVRASAVALVFWPVFWPSTVRAQSASAVDPSTAGARTFGFAIVATATDRDGGPTRALLRAIDGSASRFVVHFERSAASDASCSDASIDRRAQLLDASAKPAIPVTGASQWAACGRDGSGALERLDRVGDAYFGGDESLGRTRLSWSRQSATARFRRYRENVRWQLGKVVFATINLPDNNNNFRAAAGRNGEFEERLVADRAWLDRTFRLATERKAAGIVLFVDASARFAAPLRPPDSRSSERDGYYEWKLALRERAQAFRGQVLLVQTRYAAGVAPPEAFDHPLHDVAGRSLDNLTRVAIAEATGDQQWLRIDVDAGDPRVFNPTVERVFDDPTGELYGAAVPLQPLRTPSR